MKKALLIFTLFTAFAQAHSQDRVYFPYFELINVNPDYQYSTSKLLKTYVDNEGRYQLMLPPKPVEGTFYNPENFSETWDNAKKLGATYFLTGEMNALEDVMIVSIGLYQTEDSKLIWTDVLKASSIDDLDPILILLSKAIGTKKKASAKEDIYSVSAFENNELAKKEATSSFGIIIGGVHTFYSGLDQNFSSGFGAKLSYDLRDMILDVNGEFYFGGMDIVNVNLRALYPFNQGRRSPFLGGGLGYGSHKLSGGTSISGENDRSKGLLAYADAGYILSRTSNVQLRATVSGYSAMYQLQNQIPFGVGFNLALSF